MATDFTKVMEGVENEIQNPTGRLPASVEAIERFVPQRHRASATGASAGVDSFEQAQQDLRKAVADFESRTRTLIDEFKRAMG